MRGRVARGSAGRRPSPPKSAYSVGVTETTIRPATEADLPIVLDFVRDLAAYVNEPDAPVATVEPPEHNPATHKAVELQPVEASGGWEQAWMVVPLDTDDIAQVRALT